jgi:hypothetical protein
LCKHFFAQNITLFSKEYIPNKDCCDIKPLTRTSNPFQRGSTNLFNGKNLKGCDNFQIPQLKSFRITNYSTSFIPDGWQGVYIEIVFNNKSRLICDLSKYGKNADGFIENETIQVKDDCKIQNNSKLKHNTNIADDLRGKYASESGSGSHIQALVHLKLYVAVLGQLI